jgi:hypothetical protein
LPAAGREIQAAAESKPVKGSFVAPATRPLFASGDEENEGLPQGNQIKWLAGAGVAVLLLIWLIWHVTHSKPANPGAASQANPATASEAASAGSAQTGAQPAPTPQSQPAHTAKPTGAGSYAGGSRPLPAQTNSAGKQWRVVAFTYNRADQAQKKADMIGKKHGDLRPAVFSPTGRAPYLVIVGGVMTRDQAFAFAQRARKLGLPRDTYAQNYEGKRR